MAILGVMLVASCSVVTTPPGTRIPTQAEAEALLSRAVGLVQSGQLGKVCSLGTSNCQRILEENRQAAPPDAPTIMSSTVLSPEHHAAGTSAGGRILEVCGTDGLGVPYRTAMLFFFDEEDHLRITEPVYWSRMKVATGSTVRPEPSPGAGC
jgi:hypothetical protein